MDALPFPALIVEFAQPGHRARGDRGTLPASPAQVLHLNPEAARLLEIRHPLAASLPFAECCRRQPWVPVGALLSELAAGRVTGSVRVGIRGRNGEPAGCECRGWVLPTRWRPRMRAMLAFFESSEPDAKTVDPATAAMTPPDAWYRAVFRKNDLGLAITSLEDGRFVDVSEGFLRMNEYTREEVLGHTAAELSHWLRPEDGRAFRQTVRESGTIQGFEATVCTKSGRPRDLLLSGRTLVVGQRAFFLSVGIDVTERNRARRRAREHEQRLAAIYRTTFVAIALVRDGQIVEANAAFCRLTGYAEPELRNRPIASICVGSVHTKTGTACSLRRHVEQRNPVEAKWRRQDGAMIDVLVCVSLLDDEHPDRGATLIVLDQTARKHTEMAVRSVVGELSAIYAHAPQIMMVIDRDGRVRRLNESALAFFDAQYGDLEGQDVRELLLCPRNHQSGARQHPDCARCLVHEALGIGSTRGDLPVRREVRLRLRRTDRDIVVVVSTVALGLTGRKDHHLVCLEDVTEHRRIEAQLSVAQRLGSLGRLVSGVAHDFNNVLTAILLNLEYLARHPGLSPAVATELDRLSADIRRSSGITRQLLCFTQREAADERETFDLF